MFSPYDITSVHISIDDVPLSSKVEHVEGPLYVCLWQSELYSTGLHRITVTARVWFRQRLRIHRCATRGISCLTWVHHTHAHFWQVCMRGSVRNWIEKRQMNGDLKKTFR